MTKRLAVLLAIKAMVAAALPTAEVLGLENEGSPPDRIPPGGRVVIRAGDPGEPEIDLCPPVYNYQHAVPVELASVGTAILTKEQAIDAMLVALGAAISADRTCGGVVDYLDGYSPATEELFALGADIARGADLVLIATYSTTDPL